MDSRWIVQLDTEAQWKAIIRYGIILADGRLMPVRDYSVIQQAEIEIWKLMNQEANRLAAIAAAQAAAQAAASQNKGDGVATMVQQQDFLDSRAEQEQTFNMAEIYGTGEEKENEEDTTKKKKKAKKKKKSKKCKSAPSKKRKINNTSKNKTNSAPVNNKSKNKTTSAPIQRSENTDVTKGSNNPPSQSRKQSVASCSTKKSLNNVSEQISPKKELNDKSESSIIKKQNSEMQSQSSAKILEKADSIIKGQVADVKPTTSTSIKNESLEKSTSENSITKQRVLSEKSLSETSSSSSKKQTTEKIASAESSKKYISDKPSSTGLSKRSTPEKPQSVGSSKKLSSVASKRSSLVSSENNDILNKLHIENRSPSPDHVSISEEQINQTPPVKRSNTRCGSVMSSEKRTSLASTMEVKESYAHESLEDIGTQVSVKSVRIEEPDQKISQTAPIEEDQIVLEITASASPSPTPSTLSSNKLQQTQKRRPSMLSGFERKISNVSKYNSVLKSFGFLKSNLQNSSSSKLKEKSKAVANLTNIFKRTPTRANFYSSSSSSDENDSDSDSDGYTYLMKPTLKIDYTKMTFNQIY